MQDERLNLPSASGAEIWMNCPAQPDFVKSLPPVIEQPDEVTLSGQRIHEALRTESAEGLSADEVPTYELAIKNQESLIEFWKAHKNLSSITEGPREERFFLRDQSGTLITSGAIDRHWVSGSHLLIQDLKSQFCWNLTPSHLNKQLRIYAVLAWLEYDGQEGRKIETVRVALNKPRLKSSPLDCTDYTRHDLEMSYRQILFELWETKQPDAQFRPGSWCRWCAGKAHCQSAKAYCLLPSVQTNTSEGITHTKAAELVESLNLQDCLKVWQGITSRHNIEDAITARLKSLPLGELAELGLTFGEPRINGPITDPKGAYGFLTELGIPPHRMWAAIDLSKTKLTEIVQQSLSLTKKASEQWIKDKLTPFMTEKPCERPLVKI